MTAIMLIGEAWGSEEAQERRAFVGSPGRFMYALLTEAGADGRACFATNVFNLQAGDIKSLCGKKAEDIIPNMPPVAQGKYVLRRYEAELTRLYREIANEDPNVIIAFGAAACWALLHSPGVKKIRGAFAYSIPIHGKTYKVLPTYSPGAVLRQYELKPVFTSDLRKAAREANNPLIIKPQREIWIEPSIKDLLDFEPFLSASPTISIDIETKFEQITCIGFAPSPSLALVIPFIDPTQKDGNYWRTFREEMTAWEFVIKWCTRADKIVIGQNYVYDMSYLWKTYGIPGPQRMDDTMLMHHALHPEMEKGLGFLGSIYTDEAAWKFMRPKHETLKKED